MMVASDKVPGRQSEVQTGLKDQGGPPGRKAIVVGARAPGRGKGTSRQRQLSAWIGIWHG